MIPLLTDHANTIVKLSKDGTTNILRNVSKAVKDSDAIRKKEFDELSLSATDVLQNVGVGGVGIFKIKIGNVHHLKNINSGSNKVTVTDDVANDEIDIDIVEGNIGHQNLSGAGVNTHAQIDNHIASVANPHSVTKSQVGLSNVLDVAQVENSLGTPKIISDIIASQPAAGNAGVLFVSTDEKSIYRDTGSVWEEIARDPGSIAQGDLGFTFAEGSMPFAGSSGNIIEDNANLFWDYTNKRLGIGTNTPEKTLDVRSSLGVMKSDGRSLFFYQATNLNQVEVFKYGGANLITLMCNLRIGAASTSIHFKRVINQLSYTPPQMGFSSTYKTGIGAPNDPHTEALLFFANDANNERGRFDINGNFTINSAQVGTNAASIIALSNSTAPTDSPVDSVQMWAKDWNGAGTTALFIRTEEETEHVFGSKVGFNNISPLATLDVIGDARFGDSTANYSEFSSSGDLTFVGAGTGLPYSEIYTNDNSTVTVVSNAGFTQVLIFTVNGHSNNGTPDHANDHITIVKAGVYMCTVCSTVTNQAGSGHKIELVVAKNNNAAIFPNLRRHRTLASGTDAGALPICGHIDLAENDTIEVWVSSDSGASKDIIIEDISLNLTMVGGV